MEAEEIRAYCLKKPTCTEGFPFDNNTLVFKGGGKMFALLSLERSPLRISLKCDPERAIELREEFSAIDGAYHMNKTYWNMIDLDGSVPSKLVYELIDHSFDLIISSLSKKKREELGL